MGLRARSPLAFGLAALVVAVGGRWFVSEGLIGEAFYLLALLVALVPMAWAAFRPRADDPLAWPTLAVGMGLLVAAELTWSWLEVTGSDAFPSPAEYFYLVGFVILVAGFWQTARRVAPVGDRTGIVDAGVVALAAGAAAWIFVIEPVARQDQLTTVRQFWIVAVVVAEVALVAVAIRLALSLRIRSAGYLALYLAVVGTVVPDIVDSLLETGVGVELGRAEDFILMASFGCWGLAAILRSRAVPAPASELRYLGHRRLLVLSVSAALPLVAMTIRLLWGEAPTDGTVLVILAAGLGIAALVTFRLAGLVGTARRLAEEQGQERFAAMVENSSDVILVVDARRCVTYVTPSITTAWGHDPSAVLDRDIASLFVPDLRPALRARLGAAASLAPRATLCLDAQVVRADGGRRDADVVVANLLDHAGVRGLVVTLRDVTDQRRLERELTRQAFRDGLTGLANRALFLDRVHHALQGRADRSGDQVAVLYIDLDGFKQVNDGLGHAVGDELLAAVGDRLQSCARAADTVARLGGDEFALLLVGHRGLEEVTAVAERVLGVLALPLAAGGLDLGVRASVGIALAEVTTTPEDLIRDADIAMYDAKRTDRGRYAVFQGAMRTTAADRISVEADLERALRGNQLHLVYQPIVDLRTGEIASSEALLRWDHPDRGAVPPADFVPVAEETGQIVAIGSWVLAEACRTAASWPAPVGPVGVSVNVSAVQMRADDLLAVVTAALSDSGLAAERLTLEITETAMMTDPEATAALLARIRSLGVKLAIDDFGTGYCSLAYLERFGVQRLKIDQSFVGQIAEGRDAPLADSILRLAESLGVPAVAEGIEEPFQLAHLTERGCTYGQGFLLGRPLSPQEFVALLGRAPVGVTAT